MPITQLDVENIHRLETFLKSPKTVSEMANYLGVTHTKALDYLEVMLMAPKRYKVQCSDVSGPEKTWVVE